MHLQVHVTAEFRVFHDFSALAASDRTGGCRMQGNETAIVIDERARRVVHYVGLRILGFQWLLRRRPECQVSEQDFIRPESSRCLLKSDASPVWWDRYRN